MKRFTLYFFMTLIFGSLMVFTGCSTDDEPILATGPDNSSSSPKDDEINPAKPSFTAPSITIVGQTATTITVRVCGTGTQGAPAGFSLQWAPLDCDDPCAWKDLNSCAASFSGVPRDSRYNLSPGECVEVVVGDLVNDVGQSGGCPLGCGTRYVFRAFAHATRDYNRSPFTAALCGGTYDCAPPSVECYGATGDSITVTVTASSTGAPAGVEVWVNGSLYTTTDPLAPNASVNVGITGLDCGTSYLIKVRAAESECSGGSDFSDEITCCTDLCAPTVECYGSTDDTITLRVTAGGGAGAPAGIEIYLDGNLYTTTDPLGAGEYVTVDVTGLECGSSHTFSAQAPAYDCYGESDYSEEVTCCTDICAPAISCGEVTQSSIAINISTGGGAAADFVIHSAVLPVGVDCDDYDWTGDYTITYVSQYTDVVVFTELECGTTYVFRAVAEATGCYEESDYTPNTCCSTEDCDQNPPPGGCTRTRGFWASHGPGECALGNNEDRISEFVGLITLCGNPVTAEQACALLNATGGGCNQLGAQLIAAKLNSAAFGTALPSCTADAEAAYCAGTGCTSDLIQCLDSFNNSGHESEDCPDGF